MRAGDRLAQPIRVADDCLALRGEFVDQRTDASLVVSVGAFEVRNFRAQHCFQLACAGERAFNAVAHGGDFTSNGLRERDDLFRGDGFGLRKADRNLLHGARGHAHFLRAPGEACGGEEERHRPESAKPQQRGLAHRKRPLAGGKQ